MTASFLIAALVCAGAAFSAETNAPASVRGITTTGIAEQEYAPDHAKFSLRLESVRDTFAEARTDVEAAQSRLRAEMKRLGVPEVDVAISARSLGKSYEWEERRNIFKGLQCSQSVEVTVRDLNLLEPVTEALVGIAHLELSGIDFRSVKEGEAKRAALLLAAQAAREKAQALAATMGVKVTFLLDLVEEVASPSERSITNNLRQLNGQAFFGGVGVGIANERVRVQVTARYAIE